MEITFIDNGQFTQPGPPTNMARLKEFVTELWEEGGQATLAHIKNAIGLTRSEQYQIATSLTYFKIFINGDPFVLAEDNVYAKGQKGGTRVVFELIPAADSPIDTILTNYYIDSRLPHNDRVF